MVTTVILPISRPDYLRQIFTRYDLMNFDAEQTNLITFVDGSVDLFDKARNFTLNSRFRKRECFYRRKGIPSTGNIWKTRERISAIHNELKELIGETDFVFLTEDDTLLPINTLPTLLANYQDQMPCGLVSGVQLGRHGFQSLGAWEVNDVYEPTQVTSASLSYGVEPIDAAGFYCCLTATSLYKAHTFKPFDTALGPDVEFGLSLRQRGLLNYVNYDLRCSHLTKKGVIDFTQPIMQVRIGKSESGWKYELL